MARRAVVGCLCVGALLMAYSVTFLAQATDAPMRSWSCLTSSVARGVLGGAPANPVCSAPLVSWQALSGRLHASDTIAPPSAPTGLVATVTGSTVLLTWIASPGGTPASYIVQAGSSSGLSNLVSSNTLSSVPSLTAAGVGAGVYYVRVLAANASGTSGPSNEVVVTVGGAGCGLVPAVVTGLSTSSSGSSVTITWQKPAVGCAPTAYIIQAGSAPGLSNLANFSTGNTDTSFSASGIGNGSYYIRIIGTNAAGAGGASADVVLTVGNGSCTAAPGASASLTVSVSASTTLTFAWLAASGSPASYTLQVGSAAGSSNLAVINAGNATSYTATNVPNGTYYARVVAVNGCGTGPASSEAVVTVGGSAGGVLSALHGFVGSPGDGSNWSTLTQSTDGNFYGTSVTGGPFSSACNTNLFGCGLLFKLTPSGAFTVLYTFTGSTAFHNATPIYPYGALTQATDGNFYGTTSEGPAVFKMTPSGSVTVVTFLGGGSYGRLVQAGDGNFYGTTAAGGSGTCSPDRSAVCLVNSGSGTVFKVTPGGTLSTLKVFDGGSDGSKPYAGLTLASDGNLYGTTQSGAAGFGTVFRITTGGSFTRLYTFTGGADGGNPYASLMQGSDGNLYGSTQLGTSFNVGTIFKITTAGTFTTLHIFTGYSVPDGAPRPGIPLDGAYPGAPLVQAPDGSFIGVTAGGGALSGGTAFKITSSGAYSQVAVFSGNAEGSSPIWLIRASDGNYYGNGQYGGVVNQGAVFKMTPPQ